MMRGMIFWAILCMGLCPAGGNAQTTDTAGPAIPGATPAGADTALPSREEFVDSIFHTVVDSSFSKYYLSEQAAPCSFVKFDYDEWVKYALRETVTMDILNELAERSYYDRKPLLWRPELLGGAICINEKKLDSILDPALGIRKEGSTAPGVKAQGSVRRAGSKKEEALRKKAIHQRFMKWAQLPPEQRTVFYFSRPLVTKDGQYVLIDLDYRCDAQQCGARSTCLFRKEGVRWKLIGRQLH